MDNTEILELTFGGTYKNTPAEVAHILQKVIHIYLPPWKYGSRPISFSFTFNGWALAQANEVVNMLKAANTLRSQFAVSFSETDEGVTVHLAFKKTVD